MFLVKCCSICRRPHKSKNILGKITLQGVNAEIQWNVSIIHYRVVIYAAVIISGIVHRLLVRICTTEISYIFVTIRLQFLECIFQFIWAWVFTEVAIIYNVQVIYNNQVFTRYLISTCLLFLYQFVSNVGSSKLLRQETNPRDSHIFRRIIKMEQEDSLKDEHCNAVRSD